MKTRLIKSILFSALVVFFITLQGCTGQPIHNYEAQSVPSNIQSADQVKQAIRQAGMGLGWMITENGDKLKGTLNLRRHQAIISIPYSATAYSLMYQRSTNLDYDAEQGTIHRNYNGWLLNLNNAIQVQLSGI